MNGDSFAGAQPAPESAPPPPPPPPPPRTPAPRPPNPRPAPPAPCTPRALSDPAAQPPHPARALVLDRSTSAQRQSTGAHSAAFPRVCAPHVVTGQGWKRGPPYQHTVVIGGTQTPPLQEQWPRRNGRCDKFKTVLAVRKDDDGKWWASGLARGRAPVGAASQRRRARGRTRDGRGKTAALRSYRCLPPSPSDRAPVGKPPSWSPCCAGQDAGGRGPVRVQRAAVRGPDQRGQGWWRHVAILACVVWCALAPLASCPPALHSAEP